MTFSISTQYYSVDEIDKILCDLEFIKNTKKIEYANVSCSFDIETSSFKSGNDEKSACMYAFIFGMNGKCVIGRTWKEFLFITNEISKYYQLTNEKRLIIYVHNLAYEFQFIRKLFEWDKVFALEERKTVQCLTNIGIEFRCSYLLSGYSLATVGNHLTKYPVKKMVGDLDYNLIRSSITPLSDKEIGYILNDGLVVMAYIQEEIEINGNITKLPLTKTGYVRNYCRKMCLQSKNDKDKFRKYRKIMNSLKIKSVKEYDQLKRAFQGGFTHANAFYTNQIVKDVTSYDFTSSYPSVMISEMYPMSSGRLVNIKTSNEFLYYIKKYCCLFDITFTNITAIECCDNPLSFSKCYNILNVGLNNGRVVTAEKISTTITEQDYLILRKFYKWDNMKIKNFRIYQKGYLPTDFVKSILKLYIDKTILKGVEGSEVEYMKSKENLNSCYGMSVTDICRDNIIYNTEWSTQTGNVEEMLEKYNNSKKRFLFYPWGVWVTAYARRNLFTGIYECKNDYIYSDTDSIKIRNASNHLTYINSYNEKVIFKLKKAMNFHKLPIEMICPKTIQGKIKYMGVWDFDGHYRKFKTLGAKRYMVEYDNKDISLTVSGLNKKVCVPYLLNLAKQQNTYIFDLFNDGLYVPREFTGKNIHSYIDYEQKGVITDYKGVESKYHELSSVHMEGAEYSLSLSDEYLQYILGVREYKS